MDKYPKEWSVLSSFVVIKIYSAQNIFIVLAREGVYVWIMKLLSVYELICNRYGINVSRFCFYLYTLKLNKTLEQAILKVIAQQTKPDVLIIYLFKLKYVLWFAFNICYNLLNYKFSLNIFQVHLYCYM